MNQIQIAVHVSLGAAVTQGTSEYGEGVVRLTDEDLARLSEGARALVAAGRYYRDGVIEIQHASSQFGRLSVQRASASHVCAALECEVVRIAENAAKELAKSEARIAAAIAASDDDWVGTTSSSDGTYYLLDGAYSPSMSGQAVRSPVVEVMPRGLWLTEADRLDPRIALRRAAVDLASRVADHERRYAAWRAVYDRAVKDLAERSNAWRRATALYVERHVPEFARAAGEGKDVRSVAVKASVEALEELLTSHEFLLIQSFADVVDHARPHQRAYDALDHVKAILARARDSERLGEAGIVAGSGARIVRVDTCPERSCKSGIRTCVEVTLRYCDGGEEEVYAYADGQDAHVHGDGE